jgi:hypothetical protein
MDKLAREHEDDSETCNEADNMLNSDLVEVLNQCSHNTRNDRTQEKPAHVSFNVIYSLKKSIS